MDEDTALEVRDVSVKFGGVAALADVTFRVPAATITGLIGPNGAGKTTLFDVISGVRDPDAGRVVIGGVDVTPRNMTWLARQGVRRTFQRQQVFGWLTVEENVMVALEGRGVSIVSDIFGRKHGRRGAPADRERVAEVLDACELSGVRGVLASKLPLGLSRLVEFARAIVASPRLLLLDEPTSGLDEREAAVFAACMERARSEDGCTILLVEHDVPFVMTHCQHVIALNLGRVLAEGSPSEMRASPAVREAYLG